MNYLRDSAIEEINAEITGLKFSLTVLVLANNPATEVARQLLQKRLDHLVKELETYEE